MNHTEIINRLIKSREYTTYLEIGVQKPVNNFDKIVAPFKMGVDPATTNSGVMKMTSDEFFKYSTMLYDVIFVDGGHSYEQAKRDISNAYENVTCNGVIVVHDVNPTTKEMTGDVQTTRGIPWCGEVYRAWGEFVYSMDEYAYTVDTDFGVGIFHMGMYPNLYDTQNIKLTWDKFETSRPTILNLMSVADFIKQEDEHELRRIAKQAKK